MFEIVFDLEVPADTDYCSTWSVMSGFFSFLMMMDDWMPIGCCRLKTFCALLLIFYGIMKKDLQKWRHGWN